MIAPVEHWQIRELPGADRVYSPDILPRLQSLLAALADIDIAHEKSLELIQNSPIDDARKSEMIGRIQQAHHEQRAPYVQELMALRARMEAAFS